MSKACAKQRVFRRDVKKRVDFINCACAQCVHIMKTCRTETDWIQMFCKSWPDIDSGHNKKREDHTDEEDETLAEYPVDVTHGFEPACRLRR